MSSSIPALPEGSVGTLENGRDHYGRVSRVLHWSVALLVVAAIVLGTIASSIGRDHPAHDAYIQLHKSIGLTVLVLMIARLTWILRSPAPPLAPALAVWERRLAWTVHKLLYFTLFALPVTGFLLSQAAMKDTVVFGLFTLPPFIGPLASGAVGPSPLLLLSVLLHKTVFKLALFALLALHLLGVAKHVFVDRDPQGFLRMWRTPKS